MFSVILLPEKIFVKNHRYVFAENIIGYKLWLANQLLWKFYLVNAATFKEYRS